MLPSFIVVAPRAGAPGNAIAHAHFLAGSGFKVYSVQKMSFIARMKGIRKKPSADQEPPKDQEPLKDEIPAVVENTPPSSPINHSVPVLSAQSIFSGLHLSSNADSSYYVKGDSVGKQLKLTTASTGIVV